MSEQIPSRVFIERSGVNITSDIELLMREPEHPLDDKERFEAFEFAHGLMEGRSEGLEVDTNLSLREVHHQKGTTEQLTFYVDYFMNTADEAGRLALLDAGYKGVWEKEDIKHFFVRSDIFRGKSYKERAELAAKSLDYTKDSLADHLVMDQEGATDFIFREWDAVTCHYDPAALIGKFKNLLSYRDFYKKVGGQLKDQDGQLADAKRTLVGMHRGKVNEMLAGLYPDLLKLKDQLPYMEPTAAAELQAQIDEISPAVRRLFDAEEERVADNFLRNLDYLRNGVGLQRDDNGELKAGPITPELLSLVERQATSVRSGEAVFSDEELEAMDATKWTAENVEALLEAVLSSWGQLSDVKSSWDEVENREGPTPDERFQVVVSPKAKQLSVNSSTLAMNVPSSFKRTLTQGSPAGALIVSAHELRHVVQGIVDRELAKAIPLAGIKGRHVSTVREAGGLHEELEFQSKFLGRPRPIASNYLRALQVKLAGGNRAEATRAFYESYLEQEQVDKGDIGKIRVAAELAVDRTLRLYRNGGHNSQPLDYAEQGLIVEVLSELPAEQADAFMNACGSFDIKDAVKLHSFGLLPKINAPYKPAESVMSIYREKFAHQVYAQNA